MKKYTVPFLLLSGLFLLMVEAVPQFHVSATCNFGHLCTPTPRNRPVPTKKIRTAIPPPATSTPTATPPLVTSTPTFAPVYATELACYEQHVEDRYGETTATVWPTPNPTNIAGQISGEAPLCLSLLTLPTSTPPMPGLIITPMPVPPVSCGFTCSRHPVEILGGGAVLVMLVLGFMFFISRRGGTGGGSGKV